MLSLGRSEYPTHAAQRPRAAAPLRHGPHPARPIGKDQDMTSGYRSRTTHPVHRRRLAIAGVLAAVVALAGGEARAFDAEKHFKGQTMRLIVDFKPGGGTDIQARYFAAHWGKFIPGNPRIRVSNIFPNPAGRNYVWKSKPDGLTLSFLASAGTGREFMDDAAKYETVKFVQIGSHAKRDVVLLARGTVPYNSLKEAKGSKAPLVLAEPVASAADIDSKLLATTLLAMWLDAPLKIAAVARSGTADTLVMLERGDVTGYIAGSQWYALPKLRPGWFKSGYLKPVADLGHPDAPTVPNSEISMTLPNAYTWLTPEQKELWEGIVLPGIIYGKGMAGPPNMPPEIAKVLRDSYEKAAKDPAFAAGLEKIQGQPVAFLRGEKLQDMIVKATASFKKTLPHLNPLREDIYARYFKGVKVPTIPEQISGKITKVAKGGRMVTIDGHAVRLANARSKITINGATAERGAVKAGMSCDVVGAMRKGRYEAKKLTCK
jgi:tripartite-type tricarboxylate transporter receptor subunit TctC